MNRRATACWLLVLIGFGFDPVSILAESETIDLSGTRFITYFEDIRGGGQIVYVTFYHVEPPLKTVQAILRSSLESAALIDGKADILGYALYHKSGKVEGNDKRIQFPDGSGNLIYSGTDKTITTMTEWNRKRTEVKAGEAVIDVSLSVAIRNVKGKAVAEGQTNLPSGISVSVSVIGPYKKEYKEDVIVADGKFRTKSFSDYRSGEYVIKVFRSPIEMRIDSPEALKKVGDANKLLTGKYVAVEKDGDRAGAKMLEYKTTFEAR